MIVNERSGFVVDGHLRVAMAIRENQPEVPVSYVDLDEEEESVILATLDSVGNLAGTDREKLEELLAEASSAPATQGNRGIATFLEYLEDKKLKTWLETVSISSLRPHPRNYRTHPEDQIEHLAESIRKHGMYRNIVIARDGTILAGHGIAKAASKLGIQEIRAHRVDIDPDSAEALEILTGDNEAEHLGMPDDRALTEILKEIKEREGSLLGTGYDDRMLANLAYVTRPATEIKDFDEAAHWVGMPEYEPETNPLSIVINFESEEDRDEFVRQTGMELIKKESRTWTTRWPFEGYRDLSSLRFEE